MIKSITSVKVTGRRVIVRAGFDVPMKQNLKTKEWEVADDTRIKDVLKTLKYLIGQKAKIVLVSHLDRPEGWNKEKSLWPVALKLGELLDYKVVKIEDKLPDYKTPQINFLTSDITKADYSALSKKLPDASILFLENVRFYKGEEANNPEFIDLLTDFGDIFVNEAFSVAHRKEASTYGLAQKLPHYAGVSFLKEIQSLHRVMTSPQLPLVLIMGGIKIEDKIETMQNLASKASHIIVGGGIANTFLKAIGYDVGKSKISNMGLAKELLRNYKEKIVLPMDVVVAPDLEGQPRSINIEAIRPSDMIFDIGPKSIRKFAAIIKESKTLIWNGPFGVLENPRFSHGSRALAQVFAQQAKGKAFGVVGGGETIEVIDQAKVAEFIDHISMGGGSMLEFLAGKRLPAIKVLEQ